MALRWVDSFDTITTATIGTRYESNVTGLITAGVGRRGTQAFECSFARSFTKILDSQQTWIVGFSLKFQTSPAATWIIVKAIDNATQQVDLRMDSGGHLFVTRNGTTLGTSGTVVSNNTEHYIEFKFKVDPTTGTYDVQLDGVNVLTGTGANTRNSANSTVDRFTIGNESTGTSGTYIDDLYICDGTGSAPQNTFLGDSRVDALTPSANGTNNDFTTSTGVNHAANVDEIPPNDDTDYNFSSTVGHKDSYAFTDLSHTPSVIYGLEISFRARKDDAGSRTLAPLTRHSGTDYFGTTVVLPTGYQTFREYQIVNPGTAAAWTKTDINAAEWGAKVIA
jgi:hypothetical protein